MDNKTTPQQVPGTITISSGQVIHPNSEAVQSNGSIESSEKFIESLQKAANEGVFVKQHNEETTK